MRDQVAGYKTEYHIWFLRKLFLTATVRVNSDIRDVIGRLEVVTFSILFASLLVVFLELLQLVD